MPKIKIDLAKMFRSTQLLSSSDQKEYRNKFTLLVDFLDYPVTSKVLPPEFSFLLIGFSDEEKIFLLEMAKLFIKNPDRYQTLFETSLPMTEEMKTTALTYGVHLVEGKSHNYISISKGLFD